MKERHGNDTEALAATAMNDPCHNAWRLLEHAVKLRAGASIIWLLTVSVVLAGVNSGQSLRERYLGPDGLPSEAAYLQSEGVAPAPGSETYAWRLVFKLTYLSEDLNRLDSVDPVATDCYLVRSRKHAAPYRAVPVWDGRVYHGDNALVVAAYTSNCEQVVGHIGEEGLVTEPGITAESVPLLRLGGVRYNPFTGQLWRRDPGGIVREEQRVYLPFPLVSAEGDPVRCRFEIVRQEGTSFALIGTSGQARVTLGTCSVSDDATIERSLGYSPELGSGCVMAVNSPTTTLEVQGELASDSLDVRGAALVLTKELSASDVSEPRVVIDGDFSEWRSIPGIGDARGDIPGYLEYSPDTDLLEFKVANDERHLYFYTRVVGRHGNTVKGDDRYYYYVYIDADRNSATGYIPTRDDDCYFGVAIGDDCEAQFEFVGGRFVKTFFGFTGVGTETEVLAGKVRLGPSWYAKHDEQGRLRDRYKVEYVQRAGRLHITEDYTEGTSEDITIALSPDGSECEMGVELAGFLQDPSGRQIIAAGQSIDLAVGVEASGKAWGNQKWGADSTATIRGYYISPD